MRLVDKRTRLSRRDFLATGSAAALTLGAASIASRSEAWAMDVTALKPPTMRTLVVVARDIYPHDRLTDQAYAEALMPYDAAAATDENLKNLLENGVADLDIRAVAAHAGRLSPSRLGGPKTGAAQDHREFAVFSKTSRRFDRAPLQQ